MGAHSSHADGTAVSRKAGMRLPARVTVTARLTLVRDELPIRGPRAGGSDTAFRNVRRGRGHRPGDSRARLT